MSGQANKQVLIRRTVDKWILDNDKDLDTTTWLKYNVIEGDREHVLALKCAVCIQFNERLVSLQNYNPAFINGSKSTRTSAFKDHAETEMHKRAMSLYRKQYSTNICDYVPIAKALLQPLMDEATKHKLKQKFKLAYMVAKENLSFKKMKPLCDLEEKHGAEIGASYRNYHGCVSFVEAIATDLQEKLKKKMTNANFFSLLLDGSTDFSNVEEELFLALFFDSYNSAEDDAVHVRDKFFCCTSPCVWDCRGFVWLCEEIPTLGVEWRSKMVGLGCDGTNANIGSENGLKSYLLKDIPWLVVSWCFAHRLDLSAMVLATQGWEQTTSPSFGHSSLEAICHRFSVPLENADIDTSAVQDEWDDMALYSKPYLNLVQNDYKAVWWKLFNSLDAKRWCNVLGVVELLFCLPLSNGHLESIFSQLKIIKHDRRTYLSEDRLDQLVRIKVDGPSLEKWHASDALDIWYKGKSRRVTATPRPSTSNASKHVR